jgi:hypothetical protein
MTKDEALRLTLDWLESGNFVYPTKIRNAITEALAQPTEPRNFCPRCGKRTADLTTIHTCTPPQENT